MEELNGHCLFCLEKITPYSVSSTDKVCDGTTGGNCYNNPPPGFLHLCNILNVKLTDELFTKMEVLPAFLIPPEEVNDGGGSEISCESFLCLKCFEAVDKLDKLYKELELIQKKIEDATKLIKDLMSGQIDGVSIKSCGERKRRGRRKKIYTTVEFVEAFQKLVRESVDLNLINRNSGITENLEVLKRCLIASKPIQESSSKSKPSRSRCKLRSSTRKSQLECEQLPKTPHQTDQGARDEPVGVKMEISHGEELFNDSDYMLNDDLDDWSDGNHGTTAEEDIKLFSSLSKLPPLLTEDPLEEAKTQREVCHGNPTEGRIASMKLRRKRGSIKDLTTSAKKRRKITTENHTCRQCNAKFTNLAKYYAHRKTHLAPSVESLGITTVYDSSDNHKRIAYRICPICNKSLKGPLLSRLMEHTLSHEITQDKISNPPFSCDICEKKFFLQLNLNLHKICQHVSSRVLKCEYCENSNSRTQEQLTAHLKSHNAEIRIHACKSCPMACTTLDKLLKHTHKHFNSKRLICPECDDFVTPSLKELYLHCNKVHPELKKTFDCPHCDKSFIIPGTLRKHLRENHLETSTEDNSRLRELRCPKCNSGHIYKSKATLALHLAHYHADADKLPFKCEQCGKSFKYKSLLQNHIADKHNRTRYPCPHCSNTYLGQHHLSVHIRTHTGEGLFTCEMCGKQFPSSKQLKVHSVVHLEKNAENCCVCEICGKEFSNQMHLRKHKNSHKEKNLECEYCHMKFRRPDHLRGHLRTHTGERPFICPICSKGFNRRDIMIVHMKVHGFGQEEAGRVYNRHLEENQNLTKNEEKNDN